MKIKPGVNVLGLAPEILLAVIAAEGIWRDYHGEAVITSGVDGTHGRGSRHYSGMAVDLRTHNISEGNRTYAAERLREALGAQYDVVLEADHVHVEFDPKGPA